MENHLPVECGLRTGKPQMGVSGEDYHPNKRGQTKLVQPPKAHFAFRRLNSLRFTTALSLFLTLSEILQASQGEQAKPER